MALTQIQIIQSLAEALNWFEKEMDWGVASGELNHLTGRIGELYAAMITRGQMAPQTNQRGYDVVSAEGERISVKTVTTSNHVTFNHNTFDYVDRIIVVRLNTSDEEGISVEIVLDIARADFALHLISKPDRKMTYTIPRTRKAAIPADRIPVNAEAVFGDRLIRQYENGTIKIFSGDQMLSVAKPILREIAADIGVDLAYPSGRYKNTRQLGDGIIKALNAHKEVHGEA